MRMPRKEQNMAIDSEIDDHHDDLGVERLSFIGMNALLGMSAGAESGLSSGVLHYEADTDDEKGEIATSGFH
jgi:hypothetical protein